MLKNLKFQFHNNDGNGNTYTSTLACRRSYLIISRMQLHWMKRVSLYHQNELLEVKVLNSKHNHKTLTEELAKEEEKSNRYEHA